MANLTTLSSILKNQYIGPVNEEVNNKIILLNRIDKNNQSVSGKNFTIPTHYGRNEGTGARADGGTLPTAGSQSYKEAIVPMKYLYGRIKLTGPSIAAARTNEGAFIRAVESEMKGITTDLKSSMNRQLYGDGSGALTVCGTTSNSTTVTVTSTAKLRVGMPIDVLVTADGTTSTGATGRTVSSITNATSFVISGAAITTDNTFSIYVAGSRNLEVMGLKGIISASDPASGSLQNLAVATYPWWVASVGGNSGTNRAISETLMQTAIDTVDQVGNGSVSAIYTTYGVRRAYQALLQAQRIYQNTMKFDAGYTALEYNGIPLFADKDCTANTAYFVDESNIQFYEMSSGFQWMEQDGAILSRVSSEDSYEAILFRYCELGTGMRNAHYRLDDITEA